MKLSPQSVCYLSVGYLVFANLLATLGYAWLAMLGYVWLANLGYAWSHQPEHPTCPSVHNALSVHTPTSHDLVRVARRPRRRAGWVAFSL